MENGKEMFGKNVQKKSNLGRGLWYACHLACKHRDVRRVFAKLLQRHLDRRHLGSAPSRLEEVKDEAAKKHNKLQCTLNDRLTETNVMN
jgi:hypothetical protein